MIGMEPRPKKMTPIEKTRIESKEEPRWQCLAKQIQRKQHFPESFGLHKGSPMIRGQLNRATLQDPQPFHPNFSQGNEI